MSFKDHFSTQSGNYAAFRPTYPDALFDWLAGLCDQTRTAWDCATGSGQSASGLARHFHQVIATDASIEQIAHASGPENVLFRLAKAEASELPDTSIDLVTVAQAAHWFDLPAFYAETRRVLVPAGVLALWGYGRLKLPGEMDAVFQHFYAEIIGNYWPPERLLIDDEYRSLSFPFEEIHAPDFFIEVEWDLPRMMAYLATWSGVKRRTQATGTNPLPELESSLLPLWGEPDRPLQMQWPLFMRVGKLL